MKHGNESKTTLPIVIALFLAAAMALLAQEVRVDWDRHTDFSKYHTYSWGKVKTVNGLWDDRVKSAIDQELSAKGWSQVPDGGDVTVMAIQMTRAKPTLQTFYDGFGGWRWHGFGTATTTVETYKEGTLVVDMFETSSEKLIWRGVAEQSLSDKSDKNIKNLQKAVKKLFAKFPPAA